MIIEEKNAFKFKTKADLLAALKSLRPELEKREKEATKKHKADEQAWLKRVRAFVRQGTAEFLKMDYEQARFVFSSGYREPSLSFPNVDVDVRKSLDRPSCPSSAVSVLDRAIELVERMPDGKFLVRNGGQYAFIYRALTLGIPSAKGTVC